MFHNKKLLGRIGSLVGHETDDPLLLTIIVLIFSTFKKTLDLLDYSQKEPEDSGESKVH